MGRIRGIALVLASGFYGAWANTPIPKPSCDATKTVSVRYSSTSQRIYLESADGSRGGCATPTSVYEALGAASPFYPLETPGEWMLEESLYVLDGIVLNVYGTEMGGDCDYLRLRSDAETIVNVRAHGGSLDFMNTKVTSWDPSKAEVDSDWTDGRSYISAISEVVLDPAETCEGAAKNNMGEARMDIENSEISYLGYEAAESWGISWKLRAVCKDKSNIELYDGIGVYGNLLGSDVHHLYYGHYGYAQLYSLLSGNTVHDNEVYGFDPHDDSLNITISDNEVYFNFHHGVIWSKYCHNAVVMGNYVHDNGGVGIFPHYVSDNAIIAHNTVENNGDSGIAFLESSGGLVYNNTVKNNVHGIRFSVGSRNNVVSGNVFEDNQGYDFYQYAGNDAVAEVESGSPTNNVLFANRFVGNVGGARLDDSVDTEFNSNIVQDWAGFEFGDSTNTLILDNTFPSDMTYTSSSSCLNSASDVTFGDVCSSPAITAPFDQTDLARMTGGEDAVVEATATVTQAPSEPQINTSVPTTSSALKFEGSVSPTASPGLTAAPTPSPESFGIDTPGPTGLERGIAISSDTISEGSSYNNGGGSSIGEGASDSGDGDDGGDGYDGGGGGDGGDDSGLETMSPTPSQVVPGVPVADDDELLLDAGTSGGASRGVHGVILSASFFAVVFCILVL